MQVERVCVNARNLKVCVHVVLDTVGFEGSSLGVRLASACHVLPLAAPLMHSSIPLLLPNATHSHGLYFPFAGTVQRSVSSRMRTMFAWL